MEIKLKLPYQAGRSAFSQLKEQCAGYKTKEIDFGKRVILGEKFNVYYDFSGGNFIEILILTKPERTL